MNVVGDAQLVAGPVVEVAVRDQDLTHAVDLVHFVVGTFLLVVPAESASARCRAAQKDRHVRVSLRPARAARHVAGGSPPFMD